MTLYKEAFDYAMKEIRSEYKNKNDEEYFILWFNLQYVEDTIDTITVSVKSEFLNMRMKQMGVFETVQNKICKISGQNITLNVIIDDSDTASAQEESKKSAENTEKKVKTEEKVPGKKAKHPLLQEEFTFDTFVPGENSDFAYKASLAVAKNPGKSYNPILLYGGSGLGKTHLMEAIGNYIYQNSTEKLKICYLSAETFINEFTSSISAKSPKAFKDKYRNLDVLLLDDIHFLSGKEATQEELFYTFNALHEKNAQMVFTCDRPIKEIKNMANRLVSRLSNGLCIDLQPPNYETRYAILQKKVQQKGIDLSPEIIEYIAKNIETNVRELESALQNIIGYMDLTGQKPSIDDAKRLLKDLLSSNSVENISIDVIQKVIAENYQISVSDLKSKKRDKKFVIPRQIAIYIARTITEISYTELGIEFGGKDHSTIMHAYEKVEEQAKIDPSLNSKIELFIREIKEYKK
ncbi:MAG: chromosomal replication initiator protein DnaA [Treponema sp.]|nr:chromosomal replication initiator protein DnaA [Treponema sp.]